jgi:hypothetical protein
VNPKKQNKLEPTWDEIPEEYKERIEKKRDYHKKLEDMWRKKTKDEEKRNFGTHLFTRKTLSHT